MYYRERKKFRIIAIICILIIIWCIAFLVDYIRVNKNLSPIFCVERVQYGNGSKELYGLFYKVNQYMGTDGVRYEIGLWNLDFDKKTLEIYVEPYKEPVNVNIYGE